ncbi:DoxX family protein [Flavobacterium sp. SM2513]|uniref:DoxX family protein n=1 Tax=Flavobacterium sp. SM2513 TaxID=3424766 RepID=UPI003D7FFF11
MKTTAKINRIVIALISYLYILLFVYAAVSKWLDFENFQVQLGLSPLLSVYATYVSYGVLLVELGISVLLAVPRFRNLGIYLSFLLMVLFTVYIILILNFSSFIPCSCGGVLEEMGWTAHLVFNSVFVVLGVVAFSLDGPIRKRLLQLLIGGLMSCGLLVLVFVTSEDAMQNENPFIRRFPQGSAAQIRATDLRNTDFYIAGVASNKVYLGNRKAPLQIVVYDSLLKNKKQYTLQLEREDFAFRSLTVAIQFPYFYVYDGAAGVIFKGLISDWKARVVSEKDYSFSAILFINDQTNIIRGQKSKDDTNVFALVRATDLPQFEINETLLQRQGDGFFDTDGTLQYSPQEKKMIYTYYYRNEYIVADTALQLVHRGHTIDTTTKAKLKVVTLQKTGDRKLAAQAYMVNKNTSVYGNLLFVNSALRGRYENAAVWKNSTVVDVYDFTAKKYLLSFYVHDEKGYRMKAMHATSNALYVLSGPYLLQYGFGAQITSIIKMQ